MSKTKQQEEEPEWNRSAALPAQVNTFSGAGGQHSWRRWDFEGGTCAANRGSVHCAGAGPYPFSSPAPKRPYTCADIQHHLRQ